MSQVRFSQYAASVYLAAQGIEVQALCVHAIETQGLERKDKAEYNKLVSAELGLSLKTMQNRSSISAKIQDKFAVSLASHLECNEESVRSFSQFLIAEMAKVGTYQRHLDDISRFLEGKVPARVEAEQAELRKAEAAAVRKAAQAEADKKQAEAAAANQADSSGTPKEPSKANAQQEGVAVGNADSSENRNPSPEATVPMPEDKEDFLLLVTEDAEGKMIVEGLEEMSIEHIKALAATLMRELDKREPLPIVKKEKTKKAA